jgi:hypothetical protein
MSTPLDIRENLHSLFCLTSKSAATRAAHFAAEDSTTIQIGTWLCPCKRTNPIHNYLASDPHSPLGTLYCRECHRSWNKSCISTTTFTSPVRTVKFHNPVIRTDDKARILHSFLPLEKGALLCYICTHDGCGATWKAEVSKAWFGKLSNAVVLAGRRKNCSCRKQVFKLEECTLIELAFRDTAGQ